MSQAGRLLQAGEPDDNAQDTAVEALATVNAILLTISQKSALYPQMVEVLIPYLPLLLQPRTGMDALEETLKIMGYLSYCMPDETGIPLAIWDAYLPMIQLFNEYGADYLGGVVVPIDNFVSYSTDHFLSKPEYMEATFSVFHKVFSDTNWRDPDVSQAACIMEVLFQNCLGKIDSYVAPAVELALNRYPTVEMNSARVMILEVFVNALYYDPYLTLTALASHNWLDQLFPTWFGQLEHFTRMHDKRISALALTRIIMMDPNRMPPVLAANIKPVFDQILLLILALEEQRVAEERKKEEDEAKEAQGTIIGNAEGGDEDDFSSQGTLKILTSDIESDEDIGNSDDQAYLETMAARIREFSSARGPGRNILFEEVDELEDEENFASPLDFIDPAQHLLDALEICQEKNPQMYQHLLDSMSEEQKQQMSYVQQLAAEAEARKEEEAEQMRAEIAQEKAEAEAEARGHQ